MNTIEIKGKVNTALCYAKVVEDEARKTESYERHSSTQIKRYLK